MLLHEGSNVRSDERSVADMAYQEMDRSARLVIEGIVKRAIGF